MRTHLAWHDLRHRRSRTVAALLGVTFAITLLFMQAGFYQACRDSAVHIHRLLDFDLLLASHRYSFLLESDQFPRERVSQAAAVDGVVDAVAVRVGGRLWRNPQTGNRSELILLGVVPSDHPFGLPALDAQLPRLGQLDSVLFDRSSHPSLGSNPAGTFSQLYGHRLQVVGDFEWGAGFVGDGMAIASAASFERTFRVSPERVELGLLKLAEGADPARAQRDLRAFLPADVRIWTRQEIEARDRRFFLRERPIGLMFTSGVVLSVLVGGVILFQVLASEVTSRRAELATLQALGYSRRYVYGVVLEQGLLYSLFAFIPATAAAAGLFAVTSQLARLPMRLSPALIAWVFGLSLLMCLVGALVASRRVRSADPADLF